MGISISRKHDKRSVWRNRYRRIVYDALLPDLKEAMKTVQSGAQCVFVLKKGLKLIDPAVQQDIVTDAREVFQKALKVRSEIQK